MERRRCRIFHAVFLARVAIAAGAVFALAGQVAADTVLSLDGTWSLATDPQNVGREQKWFEKTQLDAAQPAKVPWIIQEAFPCYHGVAWYAREFAVPVNPYANGRVLLRFGQVDYLAEVWLNGVPVGGHEGGETPFTLDVTGAVKPGQPNRLAVRVLNPTEAPIDGIRLSETARRCKEGGTKFYAGGSFNHGGITESVELLCVPPAYCADVFANPTLNPSAHGGLVHVSLALRNAATSPQTTRITLTAASARSGETVSALTLDREIPAGASQVEADLPISDPHLWNLNDPYLYRVTARIGVAGSADFAERSVRCGFRDFRFSDGYFRLNGKRIYLKSAHTCNHYPIGLQFPRDPDMLRRDLLNMKVMGFNMVRFIWGAATPVQLDLCDEIGLMVYEESYAAWAIVPSPKMPERFDAAVGELVVRDRNHPSVVAWGLLNETRNGPTFRHAAAMLPLVRGLDSDRMVLLSSGRWDLFPPNNKIGTAAGFRIWPQDGSGEPWVAVNATTSTIRTVGITWPAGHLALHPGPANELSAVRWTAPQSGAMEISGAFTGLAERATTDVHILHNGRSFFDSSINLDRHPNAAAFNQKITVSKGDTLDFAVGTGNGNYGGDTTGLNLIIKTADKTCNVAADFSDAANPCGVWSYGKIPTMASPAFVAYAKQGSSDLAVGTLSNPGSPVWEDTLSDQHDYPRVPCTAGGINNVRTRAGVKGQPLFFSEYGIGSAVDLWRATRHFEQEHAEGSEDAQYLRDKLDRFLADWKNWRLDETFARPEDFFMASLKKMAGQRTLCLNAIRSNPNIVAHNLTGAIDHVLCGEGLTTLFRELKPGTIDAIFDGWYPLRWCLFAESAHIAKGDKIHLEAVLANEDVLAPGDYPARLQVIGPRMTRAMERTFTVTIPPRTGTTNEPPFAKLWFSEDVAINGPAGEYTFLATFERGAAAAGGSATFYVSDPADLPSVSAEVVLWGDDPKTAQWLTARGVHTRSFVSGASSAKREVILAAPKTPAPGGAAAFRELATRMAAGSTVVFLSPEALAQGDRPTAWLPLKEKGTAKPIRGWLYLKDEWSKAHPIFEGLPSGGLMDYTYYRELIPDLVFAGQEPPSEAVAGAVKASQDYDSGLMVSVYDFGAGRFVLNTLNIRDRLSDHPAAGRLLLNLLRFASRDIEKPLAPLPSDFARQLDALGYKE
jgi:hypothetical protein